MGQGQVTHLFGTEMMGTVCEIEGIDRELDDLQEVREQLAVPLEQMAARHRSTQPPQPGCSAACLVYLGRTEDNAKLAFAVDCRHCDDEIYYVPIAEAQPLMED